MYSVCIYIYIRLISVYLYICISVYANAFGTTWCHLCNYVQLSIHLSLKSLYLCLYNMHYNIGYINTILLGK